MKIDAFWLADYPESNIDFTPIIRDFKLATGSKKAIVRLLPAMRSVICCALSAQRSGRAVLYNRSKQAEHGDPRPVISAVNWLISKELIEGVAGFWSQDDPTLNRVSSFRGTVALASLYRGALTGPRSYEPPEYLTVLRDADGKMLQGFKTALDTKSKAVAIINRTLSTANIEINGQRVKGVRYHRVFNEDWSLGGRFYNQIQTDWKSTRETITINGLKTTEKDFQALHIALAYSVVGAELPDGDPYTIEGFSRDAVKRCALVSLNGGSVAGIRKKLISDDLGQWARRAPQLLAAFLHKHPAIADLMGSDNIGLRLQNLDSQIAERVYLEMAALNIPLLGWHDSFVVVSSHSKTLVNVMENAYREIMQSKSPLIR